LQESGASTRGVEIVNNKSLVVVDDDVDFLDEVGTMLEAAEYRAELISDSNKALAAIRKSMPDVVVIDIQMPGKSGLDIASSIKADPSLRLINIIIMSGMYIAREYSVIIEKYGLKHLTKPLNPLDLIATIEGF
jgi:CheY-like chemotaxis protein